MVNTRRIRGFAASEGIRAKTDPIDAKLIYTFAVQKRLEPMRPPSKEQVLMADLMDRRAHLSEQLTREKNRLQKSTPSIHPYIEDMIAFVEKQIAQIDQVVKELIEQSERLSKLSDAMQQVSGVGKVTAWTISPTCPKSVRSNGGSSQRWLEWRRSIEIAEIRKGNDTYKLGERKSGVACS